MVGLTHTALVFHSGPQIKRKALWPAQSDYGRYLCFPRMAVPPLYKAAPRANYPANTNCYIVTGILLGIGRLEPLPFQHTNVKKSPATLNEFPHRAVTEWFHEHTKYTAIAVRLGAGSRRVGKRRLLGAAASSIKPIDAAAAADCTGRRRIGHLHIEPRRDPHDWCRASAALDNGCRGDDSSPGWHVW